MLCMCDIKVGGRKKWSKRRGNKRVIGLRKTNITFVLMLNLNQYYLSVYDTKAEEGLFHEGRGLTGCEGTKEENEE